MKGKSGTCFTHGRKRNSRSVLVEDLKIIDQIEDLDREGWKILEWSLNKYFGRAWTRFIWFRGGDIGERGN